MELKYMLKTALASLIVAIGLNGCGGGGSGSLPVNATTVSGSNVVELTNSSLQYDSTGTKITGTITTKYLQAGNATLSNISATIEGCSISDATIDLNNTIAYSDNNPKTSNVVITLASQCNATVLTLNASETDNAQKTLQWTKKALVNPAPVSNASPIALILPNAATKNITLTQNGESRKLTFNVYDSKNVPLSSGSISVSYPNQITNGIDVGSLNPIKTVDIKNGQAIFDYVGPSDLIDLKNNGITSATFTFYDTDNPTKSIPLTINYAPDTTTPPVKLTGYDVEFLSSNGKPTTNLQTTAAFNLTLKDTTGKQVADADIVSATITAKQPNMVKLLDSTGATQQSLTFTNKNNISLKLKTYTTAGLASFDIQFKVNTTNGTEDKNVTKAITIFSGPATAMSIVYLNTGQDLLSGQFIENMAIHLADQWNNPVNTAPTIYAGAIAGYTESSTSTTGNKYLIEEKAVATLAEDPAGAKLTGAALDLTKIDSANDILVTFGNGYTYQASGKWDIKSVSGSTITLKDTFKGTSVPNLGYAVGHNYRQEVCSFGDEHVVQVDSSDGTYQVNSDGYALVKVKYDPYMVGKKIALYANLVGVLNSSGNEIRLGEVKRMTLRGHGLTASPAKYTIPKGYSGTVTFSIKLTDTAEWLMNSHFASMVEISGDVTASYNSSLNDNIYSCSSSGQAWITYNVTAVDGGSITIYPVVASEF